MLENVRLSDGNCCTDREHLYVASFDVSEQAVVEVDKLTGTLHKSWPTDFVFLDVISLEFDGLYWWTLEVVSDDSFSVKRWIKQDNIYARLVSNFNYSGDGLSARSLGVESYTSTTTSVSNVGDTSVVVSDSSNFRVGDEFVLGPSTYPGYEDSFDESVVVGILGSVVSFSTPLANKYSSGTSVYTPRAFWVFVDGSSTFSPAVLKYDVTSGLALLSNSGMLYKDVRASTFFNDVIMFLRQGIIYWLNPLTLSLSRIMSVDNLKADRCTYLPAFDLYGFGDYVYRLQLGTTTYSADAWSNVSWSTYNTVSSKIIPDVYAIALTPNPAVLHALSFPIVTTASSEICCEVYDQFFTPVSSKVVNFTTSAGTVSPSQAVTDTNGRCYTVYTGDVVEGRTTIKASTT